MIGVMKRRGEIWENQVSMMAEDIASSMKFLSNRVGKLNEKPDSELLIENKEHLNKVCT